MSVATIDLTSTTSERVTTGAQQQLVQRARVALAELERVESMLAALHVVTTPRTV